MISNPVAGQTMLWNVISQLRKALFARFESDASAESAEVQERARTILHAIVVASAEVLTKATIVLNNPETLDEDRQKAFLLGWEWGRKLENSPSKDFGYGVINHYIPRAELRPLDDLNQHLLKFR